MLLLFDDFPFTTFPEHFSWLCEQAIDKLPLLPGVLEFIGILFSSVRTPMYICSNWFNKRREKRNFEILQELSSPNCISIFLFSLCQDAVKKTILLNIHLVFSVSVVRISVSLVQTWQVRVSERRMLFSIFQLRKLVLNRHIRNDAASIKKFGSCFLCGNKTLMFN